MKENCTNIYKKSRKTTSLTRERAAELLNVSTRTLAYYESEKKDFVRPDGSIVDLMVQVYKTEWLAYMHGLDSTETGRRTLPMINNTDLARGVLTLQSHINTVISQNSRLINIAKDGVVCESKRNEWEGIKKDISELASAAMSLIIGEYGYGTSENVLV